MAILNNTTVNGTLTINDGGESVDVKEQLAQLNSDLFYNSGDSFDFVDLAVGGYLTGSKANLSFSLPLSKPTSSSVSSVSITNLSMIVRQNGQYIVGSSSTYESIDSSNIIAKIRPGWIYVLVTVTANDNATNNDAIGVVARGTVNFN